MEDEYVWKTAEGKLFCSRSAFKIIAAHAFAVHFDYCEGDEDARMKNEIYLWSVAANCKHLLVKMLIVFCWMASEVFCWFGGGTFICKGG